MSPAFLSLLLLTSQQDNSDHQSVAAHLSYWCHVTLEFPVNVGTGASRIKLFAMEPPTTGSQLNPKITISLTPTSRKSVPEGAIEEKSVQVDSTEGKLPLAFRQWKKTDTDDTFAAGASGYIRYEADLYYQRAPGGTTNASVASGNSLKANAYADFTNPAMSRWFARNNINPERYKGADAADAVAAIMPALGAIAYHNAPTARASTTVTSGGDCGGKTSVMQAALMFVGIQAHANSGWLIYEKGTADIHCQPEFLYRGSWISLEPTNFTRGKNPYDYMGVNGSTAPHLFTIHLGFLLKGEFKDKDGQIILLETEALQYPLIYATASNGSRVGATVSAPKVFFSR